MAFGEVSTGQIRFQVAVNKAALIKGHAAGLLNVIHQQICNANVGYGTIYQSSKTEHMLILTVNTKLTNS